MPVDANTLNIYLNDFELFLTNLGLNDSEDEDGEDSQNGDDIFSVKRL